jgi:predicted house-cleaning noncanonical NTP pyrophosphatase (MazG superfamily)
MRLDYNKLVRDRIPDIIAAAGSEPATRILDQASYRVALRAKLVEEAHEAQAAPDEQLTSELADVLEVLRALARVHAIGWEDVELEAGRKRAERGGFDQRIFLEYVDQADASATVRDKPVRLSSQPIALPGTRRAIRPPAPA